MSSPTLSLTRASRHQTRSLRSVVAATMHRHALCQPGMSVLVAVSGGPDSVALLHTLHALAPAWRLSLAVVHCNHGLRGRASTGDEAFVRALCARLGLPCYVRRITPANNRACVTSGSLQARARIARYRVFNEVADQQRFDRVALGHTADDQAETVLQWLIRGAGTAGLGGMPIMRNERFIRPLLDAPKADVLAYLAAHRLTFRTDATNRRPVYLRNRIRLELVPMLKKLNPAIVRTLVRQADLIRADNDYLASQTRSATTDVTQALSSGKVVVDRSRLLALPVALQRRVLREIVRRGQGSAHPPSASLIANLLDRLVHGRTGAVLSMRGLIVSREYEQIVFRGQSPESAGATGRAGSSADSISQPSMPIHPSAEQWISVSWPASGQLIRIRLETVSSRVRYQRRSASSQAILDADRVTPPLRLRPWQPGDWFCPAGMHGHRKKVQDFWTDSKVSRPVRSATPVLVAPEGILWIVGHRIDERFRPTERTRRLLIAELSDPPSRRPQKEV